MSQSEIKVVYIPLFHYILIIVVHLPEQVLSGSLTSVSVLCCQAYHWVLLRWTDYVFLPPHKVWGSV